MVPGAISVLAWRYWVIIGVVEFLLITSGKVKQTVARVNSSKEKNQNAAVRPSPEERREGRTGDPIFKGEKGEAPRFPDEGKGGAWIAGTER